MISRYVFGTCRHGQTGGEGGITPWSSNIRPPRPRQRPKIPPMTIPPPLLPRHLPMSGDMLNFCQFRTGVVYYYSSAKGDFPTTHTDANYSLFLIFLFLFLISSFSPLWLTLPFFKINLGASRCALLKMGGAATTKKRGREKRVSTCWPPGHRRTEAYFGGRLCPLCHQHVTSHHANLLLSCSSFCPPFSFFFLSTAIIIIDPALPFFSVDHHFATVHHPATATTTDISSSSSTSNGHQGAEAVAVLSLS